MGSMDSIVVAFFWMVKLGWVREFPCFGEMRTGFFRGS